MTDTTSKPSHSTKARRRAAFALLVVAREFDAAAERAFTLAEVDEREHEADQTRILAGAVASGDADPSVADAWIYSCRRILDRHHRADMDRVLASTVTGRKSDGRSIA